MINNKNNNPWERRNYYRLTQDQFIERSQEIHKDKYDYSKVKYKNTRTKVEIICPIHGSFMQTPKRHLLGQGAKYHSICTKGKIAPKEARTERGTMGFAANP